MKKHFYIILTTLYSCTNSFQLKEGDILFQDLDSSPLCDAIELVTPGYSEGNFSHIGFVIYDSLKLKVVEAIPPKVTLTELDDFLNRSKDKNANPKVIVGRLKEEYKDAIPNAVKFAKKKIGIDYDNNFILDNNKYYCSELIYDMFLKSSIFNLQPMTFLHPETMDTITAWKDHYSKLGMQIPQNKPGINPGSMSLSKKINIVHVYGIPDGMK